MVRKAHNSTWEDGIEFNGSNYLGPFELISASSPNPKIPHNTIISRLKRLKEQGKLNQSAIKDALTLNSKLYQKKYGQRRTYLVIQGKKLCLNDEYNVLNAMYKPAVKYHTFRSRLKKTLHILNKDIVVDAFRMVQNDWVTFYGGGRHQKFTYSGNLYPDLVNKEFHSIASFLKTVEKYEYRSLIWDRMKKGWKLDQAISTPTGYGYEGLVGKIYRITLVRTGQFYIGLTCSPIKVRWHYHIYSSQNGAKNKLANAIRTHGEDAFQIEILEDNIRSEEELSEREKYWVEHTNALGVNGLNTAKPGGLGGRNGISVSVEGKTFSTITSAGLTIGKERNIKPYVVERCIRENKEIPHKQRRHSKHPDAGRKMFRRHKGLLKRWKDNIESCWLDYDTFKKDVAASQKSDTVFVRRDRTKPWGPNNFEWVSKASAVTRYHGKPITIFGIDFQSETAAARYYGLSPSSLKYRLYKRKMSPEEAITRPFGSSGI